MDAGQVVLIGNLNTNRDLVEAAINAFDARGGDSVIVSGLDLPLNVLHPVVVGVVHIVIVMIVIIIDSHGVSSCPPCENTGGLGCGVAGFARATPPQEGIVRETPKSTQPSPKAEL